MAAQSFEFVLNFLTNLKVDKTNINKIADEVAALLSAVAPEINFDDAKIKAGIRDVVEMLSESSDAAGDLSKALSALDIDIDGDEAAALLEEMAAQFNQLDGVDFANLEKSFDAIENSGLDDAVKKIDAAFENLDAGDFRRDIENLADEMERAKAETSEFISEQKSAKAALSAAGQEGSAAYNQIETEIADAELKLNDLNAAMSDMTQTTQTSGGSFLEFAAKFEALGQLAGNLDAFAEKGVAARQAMLDLQAATGATGDELVVLKEQAEKAFLSGGFESVAAATDAVAKTQQLLGDVFAADEIGDFAKQAGALGQVFDSDVNDVISKATPFIKQFGITGNEAFDLISLGAQKAGTSQDDYLDSIAEYSQLAVKAGFSAKEFNQLLINGAEAGVFNTDKIADSLKELQIRLLAGDTQKAIAGLTEQIPASLAENITELEQLATDGSISVKDFAAESAQWIEEAYNAGEITESIRAQLQVAIAGTPAEDLGADVYARMFAANNLDTQDIEDAANRAGADVANAFGDVTLFDKVQTQFELITTQAATVFAPFIQGASQAAMTVAQLAPGVQLFAQYQSQIAGAGAAILNKLVPGLLVATTTTAAQTTATGVNTAALGAQTTATGAATATQYAFNTALLANPAVLVAAAVIGLVAALALFLTKTEAGRRVLEKLQTGFEKLWNAVEPIFSELLKVGGKIMEFVAALGELIFEVWITQFEITVALIEGIVDWFLKLIGLEGGIDTMGKVVASALATVSNAIDGAIGFVRGLTTQFKRAKEVAMNFARSMPEAFALILDYAKYYLNPANWIDGDEEYEAALESRFNALLKHITKTSDDTLDAAKKVAEDSAEILDKSKELETDDKDTDDKTITNTQIIVQQKKTIVEIADAQFKSEQKILETNAKQKEIDAETVRISENRTANVYDEISAQQRKIELIENERKAFIQAYSDIASVDEDGTLEFTMSVPDEEAAKIRQTWGDLRRELQTEENSLIEMRGELKIEREKFDAELAAFERQKIVKGVEIGVVKREDYVALLQNDLDDLQSALNSQQLKINALMEVDSPEARAAIFELQKEVLQYEREIETKNKEIDEQQTIIYNDELENIRRNEEAKLESIKNKYDDEERRLREFNELWINASSNNIAENESADVANVNDRERERLAALEKWRDENIISAEDYEARRLEIEDNAEKRRDEIAEEAQRERLAIEARAHGLALELQRRANAATLNEQKDALQAELDLLTKKAAYYDAQSGEYVFDSEADKEAHEKLTEQLNETEKKLIEKTDSITLIAAGLQGSVTDSITNLFAGDADAAAQGWRDYFNQLAGMLQAKASAFALDLILSPGVTQYLGALPFPLNVASIPIVTGIINAAIKGITDPIISSILSFASGGEINSPALAVVGDASRLGGDNKEWIFRNEQLIQTVNMAANSANTGVVEEIRALRRDVNALKLDTTLKGGDINISVKRAQYKENSRAR